MRRTPFATSGILSALAVVLSLVFISGCESPPQSADKNDSSPSPTARANVRTDVDATGEEEIQDPEVARLTQESEGHARRMVDAIERSEAASARPPASRPVDVKWIERPAVVAAPPPTEPATAEPVSVAANVVPEVQPASIEASEPVVSAKATPSASPTLTRNELLRLIAHDIRASNAPDVVKATRLAALSLIDPTAHPSPEDMARLDVTQRTHVERLQKTFSVFAARLAANDPFLQPDKFAEDFRRALGEQPLRISNIQLCRRVKGFGIYEAFETPAFLSGREQPAIVYVELENFRSDKHSSGDYVVKLKQELTLYNESDGLAVWQQPAVDVVDQSRNERRDFFVVQLVKLPARLTVGKYRLKVRMTDTQGGSIDETSIPLQIVADPALVSGKP